MIDTNSEMENEVKILKSINHPNIVEFIGLKEVNGEAYIIVEFMNNGDLLSYVRRHENFLNEDNLLDMASQIANGMSYLEEHKIIHK